MAEFKAGENPRLAFGGHKERGPKKYSFTLIDVAKICGLKHETVKIYFSRHKIDGNNFAQVFQFCLEYLAKKHKIEEEKEPADMDLQSSDGDLDLTP